MGAIFGIMGDGNPSELEPFADRLYHRGDDSICWSVSKNLHYGARFFRHGNNDYRIPSYPILFDGFIDNKAELLALLSDKTSEKIEDSELMYRLYEALGAAGLRHVCGQFCIAIWDNKKNKLILACDSWTSRPLYYTRSNGRYLFASEYKALLANDDVPAQPDREAIQYIQCTKYVMPTRCCVEGISALAGGTWVELSENGISIHRYQDLDIHITERSEKRHSTNIQRSLINSVGRQAEPYPIIGVSLSSGLDSTIIMAAVRENYPDRPIHAFTAGVVDDDAVFDDAGRVASHYNAQHHKVIFNPGELTELLPQVIWFMEDPVGREEKLFYYIIAREASKHVPVLLAGHNADALFGGMPRHKVVKLNNKLPWAKKALEDFYHFTQTGIQPKTLMGKILTTAYYRGTHLPPPLVANGGGLPDIASIARDASEPLSEFLKEVQLYSANANLTIEKIHAAHNVIFNSPFLDTNFVRCSFEVPDHLKIHGMTQKYILRRAFDSLMPKEMVGRTKGLLRLEHSGEFCDVLQGLIEQFLSENAINRRNLFDSAYVKSVIKRKKNGLFTTEQIYRIWSMLLVEIWARIYIDARGDRTKLK
jgi:asparagine synthase (glutamine-hydrolysing)